MKIIFKYLLLSFWIVGFCACEDYLSELPSKGSNQPVTTIGQLEGLLNKPSYTELNYIAAFSTDDCELPTTLYDIPGAANAFAVEALYHYTFKTEEIAGLVGDYLWSSLYSTIYNANLIIEHADQVAGDPVVKARVKAEAYFLRAYTNWVVANYYCLPYCEANLNELGLPIRKTTDMEEDVSRATLKATYEFIESDLAEALKIDVEEPQYTWRASRASVNAFLSRYYLHKGEYEKAAVAADEALKHAGIAQLKDYNTMEVGYSFIPGLLEFPEMAVYSESQVISWQEFFYARVDRNRSGWYVPSAALVASYDQEYDMRYKRLFTNNGMATLEPIFTHQYLGYNVFFFLMTMIPSGPTVPEVMLNRAEALLRQATPDVTGAMGEVNDLRKYRMMPDTPDLVLSAADKHEALEKVLKERRRELPFVYRWWDIRRFAVNETPGDDVEVNRTFYIVENGAVDKTRTMNYSLPVGSRRYAVPINVNDITASQGKIKQNTY